METSTKRNYWEPVKNIAIVIGALWIIIQVVSWFQQRSSKLEVNVIEQKGAAIPTSVSKYLFESHYNDYTNIINSKLDSQSRLANRPWVVSVADSFVGYHNDNIKYENGLPYIIRMKILNVSDSKINAVTWNAANEYGFDNVIYYEYKINGETFSGRVVNKLEIGTLLPDETINLTAWSALQPEYSFVYENGKATVRKGETFYGFARIMAGFFSDWFSFFTLLTGCWLIYSIFSLIKFRNRSKERTESQSETSAN
jgi:hypothetical protein